MSASPRHYMYPLNPKSRQGYWLQDERGVRHPTSVEGFLDCFSDGSSAEWVISRCAAQLEKDDFIWVHFAQPVGAIMAVGRVQKEAHKLPGSDRPVISIRWDWDLTQKLLRSPIHFSSHKQVAPVSVREMNQKTLRVVQQWMKSRDPLRSQKPLSTMRFRTVEVEQRQGQPSFRLALMVAYENKCAVTGCDIRDALQAAHIQPVGHGGKHSISNGLLLRADIHNLFDRGLLTIDSSYTVHLDISIRHSKSYKSLHKKKLMNVPKLKSERPSEQLLEKHFRKHQRKNELLF
jgi:hypothetical protein